MDENENKDAVVETTEQPSVEELNAIIASKDAEIAKLNSQLEEAHNTFMSEGKEYKEEKSKDYSSLKADIL